jgi:hypothetical protein
MEFSYIDRNGIALDEYGNEFRGEDGAIVIVPPEDRGFYDLGYRFDEEPREED